MDEAKWVYQAAAQACRCTRLAAPSTDDGISEEGSNDSVPDCIREMKDVCRITSYESWLLIDAFVLAF